MNVRRHNAAYDNKISAIISKLQKKVQNLRHWSFLKLYAESSTSTETPTHERNMSSNLLKKLPGSFASKFTLDNHSFDTLLATYKSSSEVKATTVEPTSQLKSFTLGHHIYGSLHLHLPQKCATTSCTIWALQNACCIHVWTDSHQLLHTTH